MTRASRLILLIVVMAAVPASSFGAVSVSITVAPPLLPVYSQPSCPGAGYIWAPGYWAYGYYGYYWVPGTWVLAPFIGALWTPGYWGWGSGAYLWHEGYWGPHVGFYGGINYGFGYVGIGYAGGYWNHGSFYYNSTVNNVGRTIVHNVYSKTVVNNAAMKRVSYNGGSGGTTARPTATELAAVRDRHAGPATAQTQLRRSASTNRAQLASVNHGRPAVMAASRPTAFTGREAATNRPAQNHAATNGAARRTENSAAGARRMASSAHASRQPINHPAARLAPRASASRSTLGGNAEISHRAQQPSHSSARNNAAPRPAAPHNHALAQHSASRSNPEPRHAPTPPSYYSARNGAPAQHSAQPHESTPRPQNAPHSSVGGSNPRNREGGHA
jgi:hypothetical protein